MQEMGDLDPSTEQEDAKGDLSRGNDSLGIKIGLAVFSFLLGLIATVIGNIYFKDRMELAYSVSTDPVVIVKQVTLGDAHTEEEARSQRNATEFTVRIENVGDLPVEGFATLFVFNEDAEIKAKKIVTEPRREVPYMEDLSVSGNEIRISDITLDRSQAIELETYVEADGEPMVEVYPSSASSGPVDWKRRSPSTNISLEDNILGLVKLGILALVLPQLVLAVPQAVGSFFFGIVELRNEEGRRIKTEKRKTGKASIYVLLSIAQLISSVLRVYLFLQMIPYASVIVREAVKTL